MQNLLFDISIPAFRGTIYLPILQNILFLRGFVFDVYETLMDYLITHSSVSKQGVFLSCYKISRGVLGCDEKKAIACEK